MLTSFLGRRGLSRDDIARIPTPPSTETHIPIPHTMVIEGVERVLQRYGLTVVDEAFATYRDGDRFIGLMELENDNPFFQYGVVIGIFNSHDKSRPAGAALGHRVYPSNTLAFSGEVTFARKHTLNILRDLPDAISQGVTRLVEARGKQDERIAAYEHTLLTDVEAHDLLIRAFDKRVFPTTALPQILGAWRKPTLPIFGEKTAWSLFNAITAAIGKAGVSQSDTEIRRKGSNLAELPRRTQALHTLLDAACNVNVLNPVSGVEREG